MRDFVEREAVAVAEEVADYARHTPFRDAGDADAGEGDGDGDVPPR